VRTIHDSFGTPSCSGAPLNQGRELEGACAGDPRQPGPVPSAAGISGGLASGYRFEQAAGAMVGSGPCLRLVTEVYPYKNDRISLRVLSGFTQ
jgi:hypothetical protein